MLGEGGGLDQKLDELLRRGTPEDLAAANELMKLMAGYVRSLPDSAQQHPRFPCLTTARTPHGACLQDPSTKPD